METFAPAITATTVIDRPKSDTRRAWRQWSLARVFLLASLFVLVGNGLAMGAWVGNQIEQSALRNDATITSLYVDSVVTPSLQVLATQNTLSDTDRDALDRLLKTVLMRERIVTLKVWSREGQVLYSSNPLLVGRSFPIDDDLSQALNGEVSGQMSTLQNPENEFERQHWSRLVSVYVPVRKGWTGQVLAAMEFYQLPDRLDADIQRGTMALVGDRECVDARHVSAADRDRREGKCDDSAATAGIGSARGCATATAGGKFPPQRARAASRRTGRPR